MNAKSLLPLLTALLITPAATCAVSIALPSRSVAQTTVEPIAPLEIEGKLNSSSQVLSDGSFYNVHTFEGQAGQNVRIEMESEVFDTYLILLASDGSRLAENDDAVRTNSRIIVTLPTTGTYRLLANSYAAGETGNYSLTIRSASTEEVMAAAQLEEVNRLFALNQFEEVVSIAEEALRLSQEIGDRRAQVVILDIQALALRQLGQYEQSIVLIDQGLALAQENERARFLSRKCFVVYLLGEHEAAIGLAQDALTLAETYSSITDQMNVLLCMGGAYIELGQHEQAVELLQQVLTIAEENNSIEGQQVALLNLGWAYQSAGQYEQAIEFFQRALPFAQQLQDPLDEAWVIGNLGYTYGYVGRYEEGLDLLSRALEDV